MCKYNNTGLFYSMLEHVQTTQKHVCSCFSILRVLGEQWLFSVKCYHRLGCIEQGLCLRWLYGCLSMQYCYFGKQVPHILCAQNRGCKTPSGLNQGPQGRSATYLCAVCLFRGLNHLWACYVVSDTQLHGCHCDLHSHATLHTNRTYPLG